MPPSGFSQKAVDGAVQFVQTCFEDLLIETNSGKHKDFKVGIDFEIGQIAQHAHSIIGGRSGPAGSLQFISSCYADLRKELTDNPGVAPEVAIEATITRLRDQLVALHIDHRGNLVDREGRITIAASDSRQHLENTLASTLGRDR
jgi:hypothetical protein